MDILSLLKRSTLLVKTGITVLLLSAFTSVSMADIIFDFHGNHSLYGKAKAELHLNNNYIFGSEITARNLIKLKFTVYNVFC